MLKNKDLLGIKELTKAEINMILDIAEEMRRVVLSPSKKSPYFSGKSMTTMFFENSTRTKSSFELACTYMGGMYSSLNMNTSSVAKGESLLDTAQTLDAFGSDVMVIRHSMSGAPHFIAPHVKAAVINAGDGMNEHPTQALLDMLTMKQNFDGFDGLEVAILGDIKHSRVARSNIWGLSKLGAKVRIFGPNTLLPTGIENLPSVTVKESLADAVRGANVVMGLRLQKERMASGLIPSLGEFNKHYGVDEKMLQLAAKDAILMHPGPVNRNVELTNAVIDGKRSKINDQVTNGVAVRMAVMYALTSNKR